MTSKLCMQSVPAMRHQCPLTNHIPEWNKHSVNTPADERKAIVEARRRACEGCEHRATPKPRPVSRTQQTTLEECPQCNARLCCGGHTCSRCGWDKSQ